MEKSKMKMYRAIFYEYQKEEDLMLDKRIIMLCNEFGFARQAEIR